MSARRSAWRGGEATRTYIGGACWIAAIVLGAREGAHASLLAPDASTLLSLAAALIGGANFFGGGLRQARRFKLGMSFLMTIAVFAAIGVGEVFEAATLAVLFSFAELLEKVAVQRSRRSLEALLALAPPQAERLRADGGTETVLASALAIGDRVRVRPGGAVAADGVVVDGLSSINEANITGEALPRAKAPGDRVFAGTLNIDGSLDITVDRAPGDTTIARLVQAVKSAETRRAPTEVSVAKFASIYTPVVTVLAVVVALLPPFFIDGADRVEWMLRGVTLLVIACPCALVIATPVTVVSALAAAARHGVLIRGGAAVEALADVKALAVDKTGTLTSGMLAVESIAVLPPEAAAALLPRLMLLESRSEHPIARAIVRHLEREGVRPAGRLDEFTSVPGVGVRGTVDGVSIEAGRTPHPHDATPAEGEPAASVHVTTGDGVLADIRLRDSIRPETAAAIARIRALGIAPIVMLTGDTEDAAKPVAQELGIDEFRARLLPEGKVTAVQELKARYGNIAMIGDGVNDAPALVASSVGIVMGAAGAPASIEVSDLALMGDDLAMVPFALRLSRTARATIRFNIAVAVIAKGALAVGTVLGVVSLGAAVLVGDVGGTVLVTLNAMRVARMRERG
jgi:Cd2+/Zn2+-exporting ATPase